MMNKQNRVAVVTGAAGAIGSAISCRLAASGHTVILADVDVPAAKSLAEKIADNGWPAAHAMRVDMGVNTSIEELVTSVREIAGGIDCIVNNAAINRRGSLGGVDLEDWDAMMAINLRGPMLLCQLAMPDWKERPGGRVINISSRAWVSGGFPAYATSKAGIVGLTRSLARELAPLGVTVNAVAPGLLETPFTRGGRNDEEFADFSKKYLRGTPLKRLTLPEDVAGAVNFLASEDAAYITAEVIHVCGGSQLAPLEGRDD